MKTLRLVVDVGNTRTKAALFAGGRLVRTGRGASDRTDWLEALIQDAPLERVVLGSVGHTNRAILDELAGFAPVLVIDYKLDHGMPSIYATPNTLGIDRLANAFALRQLFPGRAALAIDLGTCITCDLVDATGTYRGGSISPGMRMRARAMHEYSAKLPLVEVPDEVPILGRSTAECLASGVYHGIRAELQGYIAAIGQQHPGLAVVLTGGDALRFARALENGIFAHPFLTLLGLHALSLQASSGTAGNPAAPRS